MKATVNGSTIRRAALLTQFIFLLGVCCILFAPGARAAACCSVTAINSRTGVVTAKVTADGRTFEFKVVDARLLRTLKVGQPVYANFRARQVSLDGRTACCSIVGAGPAPQPAAPPAPASRPAPSQAPPPPRAPANPSSPPGGRVATPTLPRVAPNLGNDVPVSDIVGGNQALEYATQGVPSPVRATFANNGSPIPAVRIGDGTQPQWYVDGQLQPASVSVAAPPLRGRGPWGHGEQRTFAASLTLSPGLHEVRAVYPQAPLEQNTANNIAIFPVMAGALDLAMKHDEKYITKPDQSSYWRFRFWAENNGNIPSGTFRMRLNFYYRGGFASPELSQQEPWHLHASVVDTVAVPQGGKSEYFYVQVRYHGIFSNPFAIPSGAMQYRFEFFVDEGNTVPETNEQNNNLDYATLRAGHDTLETGKNHW